MFAGVARYVCKPQPAVLATLEAEIAAAVKACHVSMRAPCAGSNTTPVASCPTEINKPQATTLNSICGNDAKLTRMLKRHLESSPCLLTRTKGIDLDTLLRRDHSIPLNDFLTLSTVNRKILLLDSLKRHNADVDYPEEDASLVKGSALSGSKRHDLILERGRSLLLELHQKKK